MNRIAKLIVVSLLGLAAVAAAEPAFAKGAKGPTGWQIFCLDYPSECVGGGAKKVPATDSTMSTLKRVNASVNRSISPRRDAKLDVWSVNVRTGDCEDYALTKRHKLIQSGIPASALRIAQVRTPRGEAHAILVVDTDRGRFVLDNLTGAIKPLSQTRYRVVSIQTANPKAWI
jgi:predicted transglutaminase-like cysteine proteinase